MSVLRRTEWCASKRYGARETDQQAEDSIGLSPQTNSPTLLGIGALTDWQNCHNNSLPRTKPERVIWIGKLLQRREV